MSFEDLSAYTFLQLTKMVERLSEYHLINNQVKKNIPSRIRSWIFK